MPVPAPLTIELPKCGKIPYRSIAEARLTIKSIKSRGRYVRPYQCSTCGEWHITSRPTRANVKKGW